MPKKLLFVDDSASMRQVVGMAIKAAGYEVTTAVDGIDGLQKLKASRFDAIITDLNMPNMNGIELIKAAKLEPNNRFAPIVMLTTESSNELKQQGRAAGAKAWVVKPFKAEQLLGVISKLVG
jgi:two-component system, chemotaxis family, chemotaxis protein CheY